MLCLIQGSHGYGGPKFHKICQTQKTWYWILANNPLYGLVSDNCEENYNLDSHRLILSMI